MRIEYSPDVGLLYVRLGAGEVAESVEVEDGVVADVDAAGEPVGVEFLDADGFLPFLARHGDASEGVVAVDLPDGLAAIVRGQGLVLAGRIGREGNGPPP